MKKKLFQVKQSVLEDRLDQPLIQNIRFLPMKERTNTKSKVLCVDDIIIRLIETSYNHDKLCVREGEVEGVCAMARQVMLDQPMLLQLQAPVQICGDVHGQFQDLLTIFNIFGSPEKKNYLFLGDYVDRGKQSLECIILLLAYKIKYPSTFFLLRGNHESTELNKLYGFFDECKRRMSLRAWKCITDTFNCLPVAAVVGERIFCVHGGLSPQIKNLSALNNIRRPIEILDNKIIADILWADPKKEINGWGDNTERGIGYYYGKQVIDYFLNRNDFDMICRSHQVVEEGYEFAFERKLITIFSAPNYCGQFINLGAVLKVATDLTCRIEQFEGQPIKLKKIRERSLTPIRHITQLSQQNKSPVKIREVSQQIKKKRRATKIGPLIGIRNEETFTPEKSDH